MSDPQPTPVPNPPRHPGNEPHHELLTQAAALIRPIPPDDPRWPTERPSTFDGSR